MPLYRYLCCDLMSDTVLAELPLTQVRFDTKLNGSGSFSGVLALGDARVTALDPLDATIPARTALYVDRDGVLVWGGIVWTRRYSSDRATLELQAADFFSYLAHRIIWPRASEESTTGQVGPYLGTDPLAIVADLLTRAQELTGGNLGLTLVGTLSSSVTVDAGPFRDIDQKPYDQAITEISQAQQGFDFVTEVAYGSSGNRLRRIRLGWPRLGVSQATTGLVFEMPGNVISYVWPEDGTGLIDRLWMLGTGYGQGQLISQQPADFTTAPLILGGDPLLEGHQSYKDVVDQATLDARASAYLAAYNQGPLTLPELTVATDLDPVLGGYSVGDWCRVRICDPRFPAGMDDTWRITQIAVSPPETQHEQAVLTLGKVFA
jgi:hypothetical protein